MLLELAQPMLANGALRAGGMAALVLFAVLVWVVACRWSRWAPDSAAEPRVKPHRPMNDGPLPASQPENYAATPEAQSTLSGANSTSSE